jgi:uncharacterized membrane protein YiaA
MIFNGSEISERSFKVITCVSLFFIGLLVLLIGFWICCHSLAVGAVLCVLGGGAVIFGAIPMIVFWCTWQDLSGR